MVDWGWGRTVSGVERIEIFSVYLYVTILFKIKVKLAVQRTWISLGLFTDSFVHDSQSKTSSYPCPVVEVLPTNDSTYLYVLRALYVHIIL